VSLGDGRGAQDGGGVSLRDSTRLEMAVVYPWGTARARWPRVGDGVGEGEGRLERAVSRVSSRDGTLETAQGGGW